MAQAYKSILDTCTNGIATPPTHVPSDEIVTYKLQSKEKIPVAGNRRIITAIAQGSFVRIHFAPCFIIEITFHCILIVGGYFIFFSFSRLAGNGAIVTSRVIHAGEPVPE